MYQFILGLQLFEQATRFSFPQFNFLGVNLVYCNLWGVYQPQLYNVNELKCVYGVAQWN